jgi:outer membrane protein assembly factor BamB
MSRDERTRRVTACIAAPCALAAMAAAVLGAEPVKVTSEWPSHLGPTGAFAAGSEPRLLDDITQAKLVWESEEKGIGFGKAFSGAMKSGFAKGTGLPPSGAASPILAGGLVIQSYFLPRGPVLDEAASKALGGAFDNFTYIAADDIVLAIDAATGKTRWKQVFEDKGINYAPGKRGEWNVTPCASGGRVFAFGTTGRLYGLDLQTGKVLWESSIGPGHELLEAAKKESLQKKQLVTAAVRPYGMLIAVDDVLLAPDWAGGLLGIESATGKVLWKASEKGGTTSGFNSPAPVRVNGKSYVACVNGTGDLRLLDHRTGKVLWTHPLGSLHYTQPVFGKELLLVMDANTQKKRNETDTVANFGVLAGYRLSETGAARVWQLDGAKYPTELWLDGGPARKIATRRDGVIYHGAWWGNQSKLAIVREADGQVLSSLDDCKHFWVIYLWGDRFFFLTDIQHGSHAPWQVYDDSPDKPAKLSEGVFPSRNKRTCGYEVPLYEIFADGLVFIREWREGWGGGIHCYDLRKPKP